MYKLAFEHLSHAKTYFSSIEKYIPADRTTKAAAAAGLAAFAGLAYFWLNRSKSTPDHQGASAPKPADIVLTAEQLAQAQSNPEIQSQQEHLKALDSLGTKIQTLEQQHQEALTSKDSQIASLKTQIDSLAISLTKGTQIVTDSKNKIRDLTSAYDKALKSFEDRSKTLLTSKDAEIESQQSQIGLLTDSLTKEIYTSEDLTQKLRATKLELDFAKLQRQEARVNLRIREDYIAEREKQNLNGFRSPAENRTLAIYC